MWASNSEFVEQILLPMVSRVPSMRVNSFGDQLGFFRLAVSVNLEKFILQLVCKFGKPNKI